MKSGHHLIFEGAELVGKSYLMGRVYEVLEKKYNSSKNILNGCHWLNTDIGIFGTPLGKPCMEHFAQILETLKNQNVLFEKFHISDIVYSRLYDKKEVSYKTLEKKLLKLHAKIIFCTIRQNPALIRKRMLDRIALYPHYRRIIKDPSWYLRQQKEYRKEMKKTQLPYLEIDLTRLPNPAAEKKMFEWIHE